MKSVFGIYRENGLNDNVFFKGVQYWVKLRYIGKHILVNKTIHAALLVICFISFTFFFVYSADAQVAGGSSLRLIGTIQGGRMSGAVFQDNTGAQTFYELYAKLPDNSQLIKLRDDSISLKGPDGTIYDLYTSHDSKTVSSAAPAVGVSPPMSQTMTTETSAQRQTPRQQRRSRHSSRSEEE